MSWLTKILPGIKKPSRDSKAFPEQWHSCKKCKSTMHAGQFRKSGWVCSSCDYHHRLSAAQRAESLFDKDPAPKELAAGVRSVDFLKFVDSEPYSDRLIRARDGDERREAAAAYRGRIKGREVVAIIFDFTFMGGSMGSAAGERFVRAVDEAVSLRLPFLSFSSSGGARMQEGLTSLLQMAKTVSALAQLEERRLPHISILSDPTTGGVAASFALVGDIIIAEPEALVGFAGPRVIKETVREELPAGFQRSEFLLSHGAVDMIVDRRELRDVLARLLSHLAPGNARRGA